MTRAAAIARSWPPERSTAMAALTRQRWAQDRDGLAEKIMQGRAAPDAQARHSAAMKRLWRNPQYRARHGLNEPLPPMTPAQRRLYRKLRSHGISRADALAEVFPIQPEGSER